MDDRLRYLERQALDGDITAAKRLLHWANSSWDGGQGGLHRLRVALNILGSFMVEDFVDALNHELAKTGIPFNPLGISSTDRVTNDYGPPYYWAEIKERYSTTPEIDMFGEPECKPEEQGQVPGFQKHYGVGGTFLLHPNGSRRFRLWDTTTGQKVDEWLGRGDPAESYRLATLHGHYGGDARPDSWVDQEEYQSRQARLRQEYVDAIHRADPGIEVYRRIGTTETLLPASVSQRRRNPMTFASRWRWGYVGPFRRNPRHFR